MFQRTLILAAISAAFAQLNPISPCDLITDKLQRAFRSMDPHTFPIIKNVNYIRDNTSYTFDFLNLIFKGFSNVSCNSFNNFEPNEATLTLTGQNLELDTNNFEIQINPPFSADEQRANFSLQVDAYTLKLRFRYDYYSPDLFNLCIERNSLQTIFHAKGIRIYTELTQVDWEVNNHPEEVVETINLHFSYYFGDLTTGLNCLFCKPIVFLRTAIPTTTPGTIRTSSTTRPYTSRRPGSSRSG
ncbi:uncharacterized protein [Palaemon carinicauda]|uniref:uncharacterized protein n=1 Tax=Palaemon carinicauda TaxID=392227 RepID=UPI0035B69EFE